MFLKLSLSFFTLLSFLNSCTSQKRKVRDLTHQSVFLNDERITECNKKGLVFDGTFSKGEKKTGKCSGYALIEACTREKFDKFYKDFNLNDLHEFFQSRFAENWTIAQCGRKVEGEDESILVVMYMENSSNPRWSKFEAKLIPKKKKHI